MTMTACSLPAVVLHDDDYTDLLRHAELARRQGSANAEFLFAKLRRAQVCALADLPHGVVSIGSRVRYRLGERTFTRTLVLPEEGALRSDGVSIATPLGTTLLGLRVGDRVSFASENGRKVLFVEHVAREPDDGLNSGQALDRRLDEALKETFPASDPVSVICTDSQ
jgi:transcription elongation GreA/GreB family factor